jgi:hypothetical protein
MSDDFFLCNHDNWIVYKLLLYYKVVLFVKIWWQNVCYLLRNCLCLNIVLYLLFKGHTPLNLATWKGKTEVVDLLLKSGASLSVMNNLVIKPSVKLRHSHIKFFKYRVIFLLKQKMFRVLWRSKKKKDLMAAINSLNRLICYK